MDAKRAARRLARGRWGARYSAALAEKNAGTVEEARAALELSLAALFVRLPSSWRRDHALPRLTDAVVRALFGERGATPAERRFREDRAIRAFAKRVCDRAEPHLEDCLTAELLWFFLGLGPSGPGREAAAAARLRMGS